MKSKEPQPAFGCFPQYQKTISDGRAFINGGIVFQLLLLPLLAGGLSGLLCVYEVQFSHSPTCGSAVSLQWKHWPSEMVELQRGWWCFVLFIALYVLFRLPEYLILLLRLYQRAAPASVRQRCLFYPCCSEYMIGAIYRYGAVRGVQKGVKRTLRCHEPGGGTDLP